MNYENLCLYVIPSLVFFDVLIGTQHAMGNIPNDGYFGYNLFFIFLLICIFTYFYLIIYGNSDDSLISSTIIIIFFSIFIIVHLLFFIKVRPGIPNKDVDNTVLECYRKNQVTTYSILYYIILILMLILISLTTKRKWIINICGNREKDQIYGAVSLTFIIISSLALIISHPIIFDQNISRIIFYPLALASSSLDNGNALKKTGCI